MPDYDSRVDLDWTAQELGQEAKQVSLSLEYLEEKLPELWDELLKDDEILSELEENVGKKPLGYIPSNWDVIYTLIRNLNMLQKIIERYM